MKKKQFALPELCCVYNTFSTSVIVVSNRPMIYRSGFWWPHIALNPFWFDVLQETADSWWHLWPQSIHHHGTNLVANFPNIVQWTLVGTEDTRRRREIFSQRCFPYRPLPAQHLVSSPKQPGPSERSTHSGGCWVTLHGCLPNSCLKTRDYAWYSASINPIFDALQHYCTISGGSPWHQHKTSRKLLCWLLMLYESMDWPEQGEWVHKRDYIVIQFKIWVYMVHSLSGLVGLPDHCCDLGQGFSGSIRRQMADKSILDNRWCLSKRMTFWYLPYLFPHLCCCKCYMYCLGSTLKGSTHTTWGISIKQASWECPVLVVILPTCWIPRKGNAISYNRPRALSSPNPVGSEFDEWEKVAGEFGIQLYHGCSTACTGASRGKQGDLREKIIGGKNSEWQKHSRAKVIRAKLNGWQEHQKSKKKKNTFHPGAT